MQPDPLLCMTVADIFTVIAAILTLWVTVQSEKLVKEQGFYWENKSREFVSGVGAI